MLTALIAETSHGFDGPQNTYGVERTYRVDWGVAGRPDSKVRVVVAVDSVYPRQSVLRADLWDGTRWNLVVHLEGADPWVRSVAASGYVPPDRVGEKDEGVDRLTEELLGRAIEVIR